MMSGNSSYTALLLGHFFTCIDINIKWDIPKLFNTWYSDFLNNLKLELAITLISNFNPHFHKMLNS